MRLLSFKGGIHPYDGKDLTKDKPIVDIEPGEILYFSLSQHIGAPAKPIVEKGDYVKRGQMIAEAGGFVSAPVYSTVSGTVLGMEKKRTPVGSLSDFIVVQNDFKRETVEYEPADYTKLTPAEIIARVQKAGVVGMGGAGFPTHVKLSPKEPEKIEYVICNCAECEPYLTSDYRRILEEPEKVIEGIKVMLAIFPNAKGYICTENNKRDVYDMLVEKLKDEPRIEAKLLKTKFPQGAERMLVYATTGRKLNSKLLPADVGCVVDNLDTVVAIYNSVVNGYPLMDRIITITGDAITDPNNYRVPIGVNFTELIDAAGGFNCEPEKVIIGGPMMGNPLFDTDIPVIKTSSALLALTKDEVKDLEPSNCINCGKCADACPGRVIPARLADYAERGDLEAFIAEGGLECCECGCCSFSCPAKRPVTQLVKSMRKIALASKKK